MGLIAHVLYQPQGGFMGDGSMIPLDCTNKGWSSRFHTCCIVNIKGPFEPNDKQPAVILRLHPSRGINSVHAVLQEHDRNGKWTMMGGNFLHTSDSRFGEFVRELHIDRIKEQGMSASSAERYLRNLHLGAVAIHDRIEH